MTKAAANPLFENSKCFEIDWKTAESSQINGAVNVKGTDKYGNTPLHYAVRWNIHLSVASRLIQKYADPTAQNKNGDTPLHLAAYNENFNTDLIKSKEDVKEYTTMYYAKLAVRDLLHYGDLDAKNNNGYTPLLMAIKENNTHLALFLIERGANVNAKGKDLKTPLRLVAEKNNQKLVSPLLSNGASISAEELKASKTDSKFRESKEYNLLLSNALYGQKDTKKRE